MNVSPCYEVYTLILILAIGLDYKQRGTYT